MKHSALFLFYVLGGSIVAQTQIGSDLNGEAAGQHPEHFVWTDSCMTNYVVRQLDSTYSQSEIQESINKWANIVMPEPTLDIVGSSNNYTRLVTLTRGPYAMSIFGARQKIATRWQVEIESKKGRYLFRIVAIDIHLSDDDGDWRNGGGFASIYSLADGWTVCKPLNENGVPRDARLKFIPDIAEFFEALNVDLYMLIENRGEMSSEEIW
jgi:hypothetical protein